MSKSNPFLILQGDVVVHPGRGVTRISLELQTFGVYAVDAQQMVNVLNAHIKEAGLVETSPVTPEVPSADQG